MTNREESTWEHYVQKIKENQELLKALLETMEKLYPTPDPAIARLPMQPVGTKRVPDNTAPIKTILAYQIEINHSVDALITLLDSRIK